MTRPLKIEFKGPLYHITSRGNARQVIFITEKDLTDFLGVLCLKVIKQDLPLELLLAEGLFCYYTLFFRKRRIFNSKGRI